MPDTTAPASITNLHNTTYEQTYINWSWDNPGDADFNHTMVYINGTFKENVSEPLNYYNATGLLPNTPNTIATHTVDTSGNVNVTWENHSAWTKTLAAPEIIIDNGEPGTSYIGNWEVSGGTNPYGTDSLWSADDGTYTWHADLPQTGVYEVYMWWTYHDSRGNRAPVTIDYNGGSQVVYVNQQQNGGMWNHLGTYSFDGASGGTVTIYARDSYPTTYCADAVKFVYLPGAPVATIESISPNPAQPGEMVNFVGNGTDSDGTVVNYSWCSRLDGPLNDSASFNTSTLTAGTHIIFFKVQDDEGTWSPNVSETLVVTGQVPTTEPIYCCFGYEEGPSKPNVIATLQYMGAYQENDDLWIYQNINLNKTYMIHFIEDIEGMKQALKTEGSHVLFHGHANYGTGAVFATPEEWDTQVIEDIYFMDDDRIFNCSSKWIGVSIWGMRRGQAYPFWWPVFKKDRNSSIMPYDFDNPRGDPPYNYYLTYQVPNDPTYYKVETVRNSAIERFPGSRPAWYAQDGALPDPTNNPEYYITNPPEWYPSIEVIGDWQESYEAPGYYGETYHVTSADQGDQFRWIFSIPQSGNYTVYAWWPASQSMASNANYTINHAVGSTSVLVNQTVNGSQWNELGEFYFDEGDYSIVLSDDAAAGNVAADAVRITYVDPEDYDNEIDNVDYPKAHYDYRTILFRREPAIPEEELKYDRLFYLSCSTGNYYIDTFHRGIMFYTTGGTGAGGMHRYLQAYLEGKSDEEIWEILQDYHAKYDYYDFNKLPSEQHKPLLASAAEPTITSAAEPEPIITSAAEPTRPAVGYVFDAKKEAKIKELANLPLEEAFAKLKDKDFAVNDTLLHKAIFTAFQDRRQEAIDLALDYLKLPIMETIDYKRVNRVDDFYIAKKILHVFPEESVDSLLELYESSDAITKGNIIQVLGQMEGGQAIRDFLIGALDDRTFCEGEDLETMGPSLRICDAAYNQLVLRYKIKNVLRTIGTVYTIEQRDYHIEILKSQL